MDVDILLIALAVLVFALLAGRLGGTSLTMPMLFTGAGLLLGEHVLGVLDGGLDREVVSILAEVTLVLVLFTDASGMHLGSVLREHSIAVRLLVVGLPLAMVAGWLGGKVLTWSAGHDWTTETTQRLGTLSLAAVAYAAAEAVGGNGFVAAFVAGLTVGTTARSLLEDTSIFAGTEGQLLTLLTFLFFGAVVAGDVISELTWQTAAYAALSLLVVRPLAAAAALLGARLSWGSVAFLGWAGPRGLASIVYAVLIVDSGNITGADDVFQVAAMTIVFSIVLHGLSAAPLSRRYGRYLDRVLPKDAPKRRSQRAAGTTATPSWTHRRRRGVRASAAPLEAYVAAHARHEEKEHSPCHHPNLLPRRRLKTPKPCGRGFSPTSAR